MVRCFFVNFVLFTRDRILTNETQLNCFIPLSYSLIYIGCVKSYSAKFVRNHSLIRYFLHCDWLLPSTDLKGHSRLRWLCKPINVHNVHTHHLTCVTHKSKSPTAWYVYIWCYWYKGMFVFNCYINCLFFIVWPRCKPNWYNLFKVSVSVSMNKLQNYQIFIARLHGVYCNNSSVTGGSWAKFYVVRLPVDHACLEHSLALMSAKW